MDGNMDDSWVEAENDSEEAVSSKKSSKRNAPRASKSTRSPEPELVMPSLDPDTLEASWADHRRRTPKQSPVKKRVTRRARTPPSPEYLEKTPPRRRPAREEASTNHLDITLNHIGVMMSHLVDILGRALKMLKTPLSMVVAILLLFQLGLFIRGFLVSSFYSSMAPLCAIPGSSLLNLPFCPTSYDGPVPPPEFDQLMAVQSKFEDVLKETAVGVTLPIDMKRSEASIRDLRQLVRYSQLHSKNELGLEFDGFVDTAKIASFDLQKFNSHVGRAVDQVLATTRWTTRVLDDIQIRSDSRGALSHFSSKLLAPFQPHQYTEVALLEQYIKHTSIVEEEIHKLIGEAQALLMVLSNLEDRLDVIHGIVTRDNLHLSSRKDEVLSELWTLVGGNRGKLSKMNNQLDLLNQVNTYRNTAYVHVSLTVVKLQEIGSGLEDLRERVGAPRNLRDADGGIGGGGVPLSVHLDSIVRGVERLEESRERERRAEKVNLDRSIRGPYAENAIEA